MLPLRTATHSDATTSWMFLPHCRDLLLPMAASSAGDDACLYAHARVSA
jgi:hypothetical protein